jgi:DNA modification methylase
MSAVEARSVDVAVTSPPYLNNFDFAEMTRMHLYFWGICSSWREITAEVRARLIVNTTTALTGHRDVQAQYRARIADSLLPELDSIVSALARERRHRAGKKEYDLLVYPYFAQMTRVLLETQRCLSLGSTIHVVVADAAFYGIHVSTPQFLAAAMSDMGFKAVECIKLRDRGHRWILEKRDGSPTGLGEYHIVAKRENAS